MTNNKQLIIAKNAPDKAKYALQDMGCSIIESAHMTHVQPQLAYHPDMQIVKCGECWICAPECYEYYKPYFDKLDLQLLQGESNPVY
ncbi:MAG: hypothetical protein IJ365_08370, partial [Clostridia bacterium]|nr:hypothetical protein [Clostridia bacterium]